MFMWTSPRRLIPVVALCLLTPHAAAQDSDTSTVVIEGDVTITPDSISHADFGTADHTVVHGTVTITGFHERSFYPNTDVTRKLGTLREVDDLVLADNPGLESCYGLETVIPQHSLTVRNNPQLTGLIDIGPDDLHLGEGFHSLIVENNDSISHMWTHMWTISPGNDVLDVQITGNDALFDVGMEMLRTPRSVTITDNASLRFLSLQMDNLMCVHDHATVTGNPQLIHCEVDEVFQRLDVGSKMCDYAMPTLTHDRGNGPSDCSPDLSCWGDLILDSGATVLNGHFLDEDDFPQCETDVLPAIELDLAAPVEHLAQLVASALDAAPHAGPAHAQLIGRLALAETTHVGEPQGLAIGLVHLSEGRREPMGEGYCNVGFLLGGRSRLARELRRCGA